MFDELKRHVRFGPEDEAALRRFASAAAPHHRRVADELYEGLAEHPDARALFDGPDRIARLKSLGYDWMSSLFSGPWDDAYYLRRIEIGRAYVHAGLPQRHLCSAMNILRVALVGLAHDSFAEDGARRLATENAVHKLLDIELAIMLEGYQEAFGDVAIRTRRAEQLASLGTMAAGLAHQIRNPLNAAHLQLQLAARRLDRIGTVDHADGALAAVKLADGELRRLAMLIEEFMVFARPQTTRLVAADLRAAAEEAVALLAPEAATAGVELTLHPGGAVRVALDGEKMSQAMCNLLRNAIEATTAGGKVRVSVTSAGGDARLEIEDDGGGIAAGAPVFEPYFTTKDQGTGLGLAVAHRIVADHGGTIGVESRPGRTVFSIVLPGTPDPPEPGTRPA